MKPRIFPVALGFNDCYIIQDEGVMMIDGGAPGKIEEFKKAIATIPLESSDIKLIVVTHGHIDHIDSLKEIKEFTGAQVAIHRLDQECVERGEWTVTYIPKGVGRWYRMVER